MNKICKQCGGGFEVTEEDLEFLSKVSPVIDGEKYSIPEPTLCPDCRQQRRMAFRNEKKFYRRKCDLTGKSIVTMYSPDKKFKVYGQGEWWGNKWDGFDYGKDFDFSRPFFEQFYELLLVAPRPAVYIKNGINSEYNNHVENVKNCYLCVDTVGEDIYYSDWCINDRSLLDCYHMYDCELCYESQFCQKAYNCVFCYFCNECSDSEFLFDCRNCQNCFMCSNLRNKKYCFMNEQYSKEDYFQKLETIDLGSFAEFSRQEKYFFGDFVYKLPKPYARIVNSENCSGDLIFDSKNVFHGFNVSDAEDVRYCQDVLSVKDCIDTYQTAFGCELLYEQHASNHNVKCVACSISYYNNECHYCDLTYHSNNCFGCVGLKHQRYCVFNKQYTKEEYENLVSRIIGHMRKTAEWGEFFPANMSYFAYNESIANKYFPLQKGEVLEKGWSWLDSDEKGEADSPKYDISDNIKDVKDSICDSILNCESTGEHYRILFPELQLYRRLGVPVPRCSYERRCLDRMKLRNPRKLWDRKCDKCGADIETTFSPESPDKVYCEKCYLGAVY